MADYANNSGWEAIYFMLSIYHGLHVTFVEPSVADNATAPPQKFK